MTKKSRKKKPTLSDDVRQVQASQWMFPVEVDGEEFWVNSPIKHTILNKKDSKILSISIVADGESLGFSWPNSSVLVPKPKKHPKKRG